MSININPDTTSVTVTAASNTVTVVDTANNVNVSTSQPITQVVTVAIPGPQGPAGTGANFNTGSFAITGSNIFYGLQTITASNVDPSALDIHVKDDGLWTFRTYNDTYSPSLIGLASWIDNTGISFLGTETDKPLYLYNNAQYYQPTLLISSSGVTISNNLSITGNQVITGSLTVSGSSTFTNIGPAIFSGSVSSTQGFTGSLQGTASISLTASFAQGYVLNSSTSSFVNNSQTSSFVLNSSTSSFVLNTQTGSFAGTGSVTFTGSQIVTGSTRGNITPLTVSSNTASLNLSLGNFYTLQLTGSTNTFINPSNILPGQTSILSISTTGSATVSFPSSVKQPSGSAYVPTTTTGVDILTLVSFDSTTLYVANIKNLI